MENAYELRGKFLAENPVVFPLNRNIVMFYNDNSLIN